ncbi:MAG: Lrp/AsnC family transcriptional regulator, partial [Acetobacteraceae bacterium]|nr:Lrp/AsnC family transcriptional regulator [Acetobacteraceae bacterium]
AAGVITRRVALVAPERVGMGLTVFVAVEAGEHTPAWLAAFAEAVTAMPSVMEVYRMAGEVDYMLRVAVADMAEFDSFYKQLIAAVPLKNVTSRFAMERIKSTTAYPLHGSVFRDRAAPEE